MGIALVGYLVQNLKFRIFKFAKWTHDLNPLRLAGHTPRLVSETVQVVLVLSAKRILIFRLAFSKPLTRKPQTRSLPAPPTVTHARRTRTGSRRGHTPHVGQRRGVYFFLVAAKGEIHHGRD